MIKSLIIAPFFRYVLSIAKIGILCLILVLLYRFIGQQQIDVTVLRSFVIRYSWIQWMGWLLGGLILSLLNWWLEIFKWKVAVQPIQRISLKVASQQVLKGSFFGAISPGNIGDFLGRSLGWPHEVKQQIIGINLYASSLQNMVTVGLALFATFFTVHLLEASILRFVSEWLFLIVFGWFVVLILHFIPSLNRFNSWLQGIESLTFTRRTALVALTVLRSLFFTAQFVWCLHFCGISLPLLVSIPVIQCIFLVKTIGSWVNMWGDLGSRQLAAVYLFGFLGVDWLLVTICVWLVWAVNILLPVLTGGVLWLYQQRRPWS
ncbi:MAG: hypothetical protein ACK4UP_07695 [Spirosomataceae bacterium]